TGAVADDDERGEAETPTALDDLGDTIDADDAGLAQRGVTRVTGIARRLVASTAGIVALCHVISSLSKARLSGGPLEVEPSLACGFGDGLDSTVVAVATSVEYDLVDAGGLGT